MKKKIFAGIMALALGFAAVSCSDDDDYSPASGEVVQSVVTGSSDVTASSAKLNGAVKGLGSLSASSYAVGFYYGNSAEALTKSVDGSLDGEALTAEISGLEKNTTIYYQAYVTLQKTVTYKGDVKSLITTDASVVTSDASNVDVFSATIGGAATNAPSSATAGVVLAASSDVEAVRAGLRVSADDVSAISVTKEGLLPGATYYYAAFLDLGTGVVYGDVKEFETKEYSFDVNDLFVDLGLSTKWAKCNIGAAEPEDLGGLFAFGDMTGLNPSKNIADYAITSDVYKTSNDLAFKVYGGKATMPSADEFEELIQKCTSEWTEVNGVNGCKFTGPNGNSIFLPAAGSRKGSVISGAGSEGLYLTGSVNSSNSDFAVSYDFASGVGAKSTTPRYQALSVRAVTVAKNVPLDINLLCKKWQLDITAEGTSYLFGGPMAYYGTDDCWANVTNNEPVLGGDHWNWSPKYSENTWLGEASDYGYMEFSEDGTVNIHRRVKDEDGAESYQDVTGAYTVDYDNKTITLDCDVLGFHTYNDLTLDAKTNLKILSLDENGLQIAILRDPGLSGEGACQLAYQYINEDYYQSFFDIEVNIISVDSSWGGTWGTLLASYSPSTIEEKGSITETVTYEGAMPDAQVFTLDFVRFAKRFPNGMVRIDAIKADGKDVVYNANRFRVGDIEENGNYRVEMFNAYGDTKKAGCSPFSNNAEELKAEPAVGFSNKLEITYTIIAEAPFAKDYDVLFIDINPSWGGDWELKTGSTIAIGYDKESHLITFNPVTIDYTFESTVDYSAGSIMAFFQIADLYSYFPQFHATVDAVSVDGKDLSFDASKIVDSSDGGNYRLELWNMYGATASNGCAFGEPVEGAISELAFNKSMKVKATFHSIFPEPTFE